MYFNKEKFKQVIKVEIGNFTLYKLLKEKLEWELILNDDRTFSINTQEKIKAVIEVIDKLLTESGK